MKKYIIGFIIGAILFGGIAGVTAYTIAASEIEYNGSSVESALNNLYDKATNYKKLDTQTSATANDIVSGKTAYDNLGNLISGTYSDNCFSGSRVVTHDLTTSNGGILFDFVPSEYFITANGGNMVYYKEGLNNNNVMYLFPGASSWTDGSSNYAIKNGKYYGVNWGLEGTTFYYMVCK